MRYDHPLPVVLALFAFAGLAVAVLHPRPAVRLEGEVAMLQPAEALQELDAAAEDIRFGRNLALTHAALALDAGEFATARTELQRLVDDGEDTIEVQQMMADAERLSGHPQDELPHLAAAYALNPTTALRQQLGLAYRNARLAGNERALLMSVPAPSLTVPEAHRLAGLLREARDFTALEQLYRARAELVGPEADAAKQSLINFELEAGRPQTALSLAMHWFAASGQDQRVLQTAIPAFINWGAPDAAMSLALSVLKVSPDTSYALIPVFLDGGRQDGAFVFQRAWLNSVRKVPDAAWPILIDSAERTGNLEGLRAAFAKSPPGALAADQLGKALLQVLRYQGIDALLPYRAYLRPDVVASQPLIGAAWAARQGDQSQAADLLLRARGSGLSEWDWNIWTQIAAGLRGSPAYPMLFAGTAGDDRAQSVLATAFKGPAQPQLAWEPGRKGD